MAKVKQLILYFRVGQIPQELINIQSAWAEQAASYGDVGSCVIGAGFEFDYQGVSYEMPPCSPWQGSCSWEAFKDEIGTKLEAIGCTNIQYHWGSMD